MPSNASREIDILLDDTLKQKVADRLTGFPRRAIDHGEYSHAAVAFTILDGEDRLNACFLLTRRPTHLKRHSGQYALPGGRIERGETIEEAALRELEEEIGISIPGNDVLGVMDDYQTRSGFVITPVVIWAGHRTKLNPDPNEVAKTYRVPLSDLCSSRIPVVEDSGLGESQVLSTPIKSLGHRIFAPTAAFIYQFREVVLFDRPTRVALFDQPKFAWS